MRIIKHKYICCGLILLFCLQGLFSFAQGWRSRFYLPGAYNNAAKAIYETTPNNYISIGIVVDTSNGGYSNKLCLMGLTGQGQLQWKKKYGSPQFEYLDNSLLTRWAYFHNNFLFYACCVKQNNKYHGVLIKFNLNGDTLWQKVYRDTAEDVIPQRVTGSVDGGFLLTGFFQNWTTNTNPCLLIKTDANGNELWRKKFHKPVPDVNDGRAIVQDTASKRIIIGGYQYIGNASAWETYDNILVLDSLGNELNRVHYTGMGGAITDLIQTSDKKIVAVGAIITDYDDFQSSLTKSYIVKFKIDSLAGPVWQIPGLDQTLKRNYFTTITELPNTDIVAGGIIDTMYLQGAEANVMIRLTKLTANGTMLQNNYYAYKPVGASNDIRLLCLNRTADNGLVAAIEGYNYSPNPFFFVKFDSNGCDSTLAYCDMVAAGIGTTKLTEQEVSVFPNPVSSYLNIRFENTHSNELLFAMLTDLYGREVKRVQLEQNNSVDLKDLAGGLYLLSIGNSEQKLMYHSKIFKQE